MNSKPVSKSIPYVIIAIASIFMFRGIFAKGFMSGYDNSFHYFDVYYLINTLIPDYHWISGWSLQSLAGFPVMVDYYQTGHILVAFLNKILFMPLVLSYKAMVLLSYMVMAAGFYKLSSSRFGKVASLLIALCFMLQKDIYNDRILGGMWNNYLAIGILFIFLDVLDRSILNLTRKKVMILGLLLGFIILTHLYVAIFAFLLLVIYAFPYAKYVIESKRYLGKICLYVFIPTIAFLVSLYYLYGFVVSRNYFADIATKDLFTGLIWSAKSFFSPIERGPTFFLTLAINMPIFARILFSFFGVFLFFRETNSKIKRFLNCTIAFIFVSVVLFSDIFANLFSWWSNIPFIGDLQTNRFLIYIQIGMYIFAAFGLFKILTKIRKKKLFIFIFTSLLAISFLAHYAHFARYTTRTLEESDKMEDIKKVWSWINDNVPEGVSRVVYQNTIGNMEDPILNRSDVFALSGVFANIPQIGVARSASPFPQEKFMRNDHGRIFGKPVEFADIVYMKDIMYRFNAPYIVTVEPTLEKKLKGSNIFFHEQKIGEFDIFKLKSFQENWLTFKKPASYKVEVIENHALTFSISNKSTGNEAFLKFSYHPLWQAFLNKNPVEIQQDSYGMMKLALADKGEYLLELKYKPINYLLAIISLVTFGFCVFILAKKTV